LAPRHPVWEPLHYIITPQLLNIIGLANCPLRVTRKSKLVLKKKFWKYPSAFLTLFNNVVII
jgi:hypothetical protein